MPNKRMRKAICNKDTGEIEKNCFFCGVYDFPDEDTAVSHFNCYQESVTHVMVEITEKEAIALGQYKIDTDRTKYKELANKIDLDIAKRHLKDREKVAFDIHTHGMTYQDFRPLSALVKR